MCSINTDNNPYVIATATRLPSTLPTAHIPIASLAILRLLNFVPSMTAGKLFVSPGTPRYTAGIVPVNCTMLAKDI